MHIFQDKDGRYFVLLPDVWRHIIEGHPEMEKHLDEIEHTLSRPMAIYRSRRFGKRHLYYKHFRNKLFFAVVVDVERGIIKTFFATDRIKEGEIIWREEK